MPSSTAQPQSSDTDVGNLRATVRRFIGSRVRDAATADDLTQEVFVKMQRRISQVRDPRRLMGWLIQIARHTMADHFRAARPTEPLDEQHLDETEKPGELPDSEEQQLRDDLTDYIRCVVRGLPPIYRQALEFTEYDGLSQVELAQRIGLSVSAAKSRVQRARSLVRDTINRCCKFEVDRYGTVLGYAPRNTSCRC